MRRLPLLFGCILVFFASARILLEKKLGNDPRLERTLCRYLLLCSDERLLEKAEEQLTQGGAESLDQAVANLQEALRRNPASADRWCDLGEALLKSGQTEKARTCFSRALELGGESIQIHSRGRVLLSGQREQGGPAVHVPHPGPRPEVRLFGFRQLRSLGRPRSRRG